MVLKVRDVTILAEWAKLVQVRGSGWCRTAFPATTLPTHTRNYIFSCLVDTLKFLHRVESTKSSICVEWQLHRGQCNPYPRYKSAVKTHGNGVHLGRMRDNRTYIEAMGSAQVQHFPRQKLIRIVTSDPCYLLSSVRLYMRHHVEQVLGSLRFSLQQHNKPHPGVQFSYG